MISLRQHAISLAAVFLALAVGVVLGSGVLSDTLLSGLRDQKKDLQGQIAQLTDDKNMLNEKLSAADDFNTQMSGRIVRDALAGKSVVLLRTPDANDDDLEAIGRVLGQSGAATTGTISLTQEFVDANSAEKLRSVVNSSILPAGTRLNTTLVDQGSQAGDLLGIALLSDRNPDAPKVDDAQRETVLTALRDTGFLTYTPEKFGPADAALIVTGVHSVRTPATRAPVWPAWPRRWRRAARAPCSPAATAPRRVPRRWPCYGRIRVWPPR